MECCNPFALFVWLYKCQYPVFFKIRGQRADPNKQCYTFKATPHDSCGLQGERRELCGVALINENCYNAISTNTI